MNLDLIGLFAYSALLMAVGLVMSRRIKTASDFLAAGRRLAPGLILSRRGAKYSAPVSNTSLLECS